MNCESPRAPQSSLEIQGLETDGLVSVKESAGDWIWRSPGKEK